MSIHSNFIKSIMETDLETITKRVQNLEKFKKLFFEMEDQWKEAKQEAQLYYERLMSMRDDVKDQKGFHAALNSYNNVYKEIEKTILEALKQFHYFLQHKKMKDFRDVKQSHYYQYFESLKKRDLKNENLPYSQVLSQDLLAKK